MRFPFLVSLVALTLGCRSKPDTGGWSGPAHRADQVGDGVFFAEPEVSRVGEMRKERSSPVSSASGGAGPAEAEVEEDFDASDLPRDATLEPRMVHYDGFARIRATRVDEALDAIAALAEQAEGRVERLSRTEVSIRVPGASFDEIWQGVLQLGDVLDQSVRAEDITEQFLAIDLRVRTHRTTRDKLIQLLEGELAESERLRLIHQLQRVTDELDRLERQLRTLSDLAGFARISVKVVPREAFQGSRSPELAGFAWIRRLAPFHRAPFDDVRRVDLPEPEGMVVLDKRGPFRAESADGVSLWTLRQPNDPVGEGAFWIQAIEERIGDDFEQTRSIEVGSWSCLALRPAAEEPYEWRICLRPQGRHLHIAQAYFPGDKQIERYGAAIDAALAGGAL
ncbi:MAG: DUF4349 domain-containing protein [Deltaproteobacteria bacterium]|nr:MAG: DUF4349 domain-containing protein [Deltaproteobacteria bacterium]